MTIPNFCGEEDKDEINLVEWLRTIKENGKTPLEESDYFYGEAWM
jgi:hypothetical protein